MLNELDFEKARRVERRKRSRMPAATSRRNQAVQAFGAMHVEALQWSNISVRVYAEAHRLSVERLYHWRELIANGTVEVDWRSMLHPSARPSISTMIRPTSCTEDRQMGNFTGSPFTWTRAEAEQTARAA